MTGHPEKSLPSHADQAKHRRQTSTSGDGVTVGELRSLLAGLPATDRVALHVSRSRKRPLVTPDARLGSIRLERGNGLTVLVIDLAGGEEAIDLREQR